jgi:hypothetical protein
VVLRLHKAGQHEQVIACIEGALLNGQSHPWMYSALALAMEKAGRPRSDIERVLLSGVDFSAVNVANILYSASFLTSFGAKDRALELYRQASQVDPLRLEPYVLGLKLARENSDPAAVEWAATGILRRAWNKDYQTLHRDAEATLLDMQAELRRDGRAAEAERLGRSLDAARQRDLVIELSWSGKADLDLLVEEPSGAVCSSDNPTTTGGGIFVHDGLGTDVNDAFDKYVCPQGISGDYRAIVRHVGGDVVGKRALLRVIRYQGTPREVEQKFVVQLADQDKVIRVSLQHGRLQTLTENLILDAQRDEPRVGGGRQPELGARRRRLPRSGDELDSSRQLTGNAAVGYQPVISLISQGVQFNTLAVISGDRRYVRLAVNPIFSVITDVQTFSFINGGNAGGGGGAAGGGAGGGGTAGGGVF